MTNSMCSMQWTPDLPEAFAVLGFAFYLHPMVSYASCNWSTDALHKHCRRVKAHSSLMVDVRHPAQLMPLVHEMPRGEVGIKLTKQAVNIVVMGAHLCALSTVDFCQIGLDAVDEMCPSE